MGSDANPCAARPRSYGRPPMRSSSWVVVFASSLAACANDAEPFRGFGDTSAREQTESSTVPEQPADAARCAKGGSGRLLHCSSGCASSMFDSVLFEESFDSAYETRWTPAFAAPSRTAEGLRFGPHPLPAEWWHTYSPTISKRADFGDVLLCIRARSHAGPQDGANAFEITLRAPGSSGMVLGYSTATHDLNFATKIADGQWVQHAHVTPTAAIPPGPRDVEIAFAAHGDNFHAELKDVASGAVQDLHAVYALPPAGPVTLLGWQLAEPLVLSRLVIGVPGADARARIEAP